MLVMMATVASFVSFASGIAAVGSGRHFRYTFRDLLARRQNALLYVWVVFSSIFSMAHFSALLQFGLSYHWAWKDHETGMWMSLHTAVAALLIGAHLYIKQGLRHASVEV